MTSKTLVLNSDLRPLSVIDWERAISLVFANKVELLHNHEAKVVRSANREWGIPSVIKVKRWVKVRTMSLRFNKKNVFVRDNFICQYCFTPLKAKETTLDHIIPKSRGGTTNWRNVTTCCIPCNQYKSNRTPQEANMTLMRQPFIPKGLTMENLLDMIIDNETPPEWRFYLGV